MAGLSRQSKGRGRQYGQKSLEGGSGAESGIQAVVGSMTHFYQKAAEKSGDAGARRMFLTLAAEEQEQIKDIGPVPGISGTEATKIRQMIRSLEKSERALLHQIRPETDEIGAMKIAMEMEKAGIRLYCGLLPKLTNPDQKKIVNRLIRQEQERYAAIDNTCSFLAEPDRWFLWEEQSCTDGGTPWA